MSRLTRIRSKQTTKKTIIMAVGGVVLLWFVFTSGFAFLVNSSVFIGNLLGGGRSEFDFGATPEFYNVEFDELPDSTNSASLAVSGLAENLDRITIYINGTKQKTIEVDDNGQFSTVVSGFNQGSNQLYAEGKNDTTSKTKKSETLTIQYKTSKPVIEITEPSDGHKTPRDEIKVAGKTNSEPGLSIRVQGAITTPDPNGNFQASVRLKEGENKILIVITDSAGNKSEKELTVFYEK